jgi:hypothetical protein
MQGRNIIDEVAILHKAVHEMHTKKLHGVILKSNGIFYNRLLG